MDHVETRMDADFILFHIAADLHLVFLHQGQGARC